MTTLYTWAWTCGTCGSRYEGVAFNSAAARMDREHCEERHQRTCTGGAKVPTVEEFARAIATLLSAGASS